MAKRIRGSDYYKTGCAFIDDYAENILTDKITNNDRLTKPCIRYHLRRIHESGAIIDQDRISLAKRKIEKYFNFKLMDWQLYLLGLIHCYEPDGEVLFRKFLIMMGTGNGKNGFISGLIYYLVSPEHGVDGYNVDIIANSEDQAKTSFTDVYEMLGDHEDELVKTGKFYKSLSLIRNNETNSYIKFNTSGSKTKAGKRSACMVYDEIYNYINYDVINELEASFGKKPNSRIFMITSNGGQRDGVLDNELKTAEVVVEGGADDMGYCPLLYAVGSEAKVLDPDCWAEANPSLPYLKPLQKAIKDEFAGLKFNSEKEASFYTKRMGWPKVEREMVVASIKEIETASQEIDVDLLGRDCIAGLDYALLSDMASVGLLFRDGEKRYWLQHSWICRDSCDWDRIKAPLEKWERNGELTIVHDVQISPYLIRDWLYDAMQKYNILELSMDTARLALMREVLGEIGFTTDKETRNIWLTRPLGIASVSPVIESWFRTGQLRFGHVEVLRWAINNTKRVRMTSQNASGNYRYDKIEPRSRKNDPFMALVHAAVRDELLEDTIDIRDILGMSAVVG